MCLKNGNSNNIVHIISKVYYFGKRIRRNLRRNISSAFYLLNSKNKKGIVVLNYHRINDTHESDAMTTSAVKFYSQMEYLYKNNDAFQVVDFRRMIDTRNNCLETMGGKISQRIRVLITFDDGYRDTYLHAYPILKKFNFSAVIFLISGLLDDKDKPFLDYLRLEEIEEMEKNNVFFGSHSVNHLKLTRLPLMEAKKEIAGSKLKLEKLLNVDSFAFAYPFGAYNDRIQRMVKDAGYSCAFTVKNGINDDDTDIFTLKRMTMNGNDSDFDFKKKIRGYY